MKKAENNPDPQFNFSTERYSYGPDGSRVLVIERQRRGLLKDEVMRFKKEKEPFKPDNRLALTTLCKVLRAQLDAAQLPTDQWPVVPIEQDFGYYPHKHG